MYKVIFLLLLSLSVSANSVEPKDSLESKSFIDYFDLSRNFISQKWMNATRGLDNFFALRRIEEENDSQIRLDLSARKAEYEDFDTGTRFKIKIRLHSFKQRWRIFLESRDRNERYSDGDYQGLNVAENNLQEQAVDSGLEISNDPKKALNFSTRVGARLNSGVNPFVRFRLRRFFKLSDKWQLNITEQFRYRHSDRGTEYTFIEFNREINDNFSFRLFNFKVWEDQTNQITYGHTISLFQKLSNRRAMSYNFTLSGNNKPKEAYNLWETFILYRQLLHKDWMYVEFKPSMFWDREFDFRKTAAFEVKLQIFFN